ncbi:MAG: DNA topoisomerase III, partial [Oscillospiraceae bacterium]|nr:DNA topoisomerase III [Oscillospiraceae bacterium]
DSRYIPQDVVPSLPDRLRAAAVGSFRETAQGLLRQGKLSVRFLVNDAKVTDHHAILPTEESPNFARLSREEGHIYDLVVRRFLAVLSAPHEYDALRVRLQIGGHSFFAAGKTVRQAGWRAVYGNLAEEEDGAEAESGQSGQVLPPLAQGAVLVPSAITLQAGKTKPPARYTEATLLTAMENPPGLPASSAPCLLPPALGTPATRADIIEKLLDAFYVERRGKELVPTAKGKQLIQIVPQELKSAALTAQWEQQLALIAQGKTQAERFTGEMRTYAAKLVSETIASDAKYIHENLTQERCPECGKQLLDVNGKKGRMLICQDRGCGFRKSLSVITNARCPECHKKLELRGDGEKRSFFCVCGFRERLADFEKRREATGANKRETERFLQTQQKETRSTLGDLFSKLSE